MKWYTCTPVAFGGGPDFFARDSGLLSRGFQSIGLESRAIMPGVRESNDMEGLIRTSYGNLESVDWWRNLGIDGLVLYAWGSPRFRRVAGAVKQAGIQLVLNQDSGGLVSPLAGWRDWLLEQRILSGGGPPMMCRLFKGLSYGLVVTDPLRAKHLAWGDVIACVSPVAADHYRKLLSFYGRQLEKRVHVVPHPVEGHFKYSGVAKVRQIVCIGRWHDTVQKRPGLLMGVIEQTIASDDEVAFEIVGEATDAMRHWHGSLRPCFRERVALRGRLSRVQLVELLGKSQIFYSPSAFESFGIAAAEALCCGCSVVAGHSVSMASFEWFVGDGDGRLAMHSDAKAHSKAMLEELAVWGRGGRDPRETADRWSSRLHASEVARRILELFD